MATITGTVTRVSDPGVRDVWIASWPAMGNADTGTAIAMSGSPDRSVQIEGTFGSATVVLQGSNDGSNWQTLTDPQGNDISKTSADLEGILELTRYVRPVTSGGTGTSVTVTVLMKGQRE